MAPESLPALQQALFDAKQKALAVTVIGEGSNLLIVGDIAGLVINPRISGMIVTHDEGESCLVEVGCGEHFDELVAWSLQQGLQGLENLSLIPGTVGAAPYQNIGAYGVELSDLLVWVEALSISTAEVHRFSLAECQFDYRDSVFKSHQRGQWLITSICLRLNKQHSETPLVLHYADLAQRFSELEEKRQNAAGLRDIICALRRSKLPDPQQLPNAGSFFKNPIVTASKAAFLQRHYPNIPAYQQATGRVKLAAGWLIEQAGFKGVRHGSVGMHQHQALVLVNYGGATGKQVMEFAERVKQAVWQKFCVELEREPLLLQSTH